MGGFNAISGLIGGTHLVDRSENYLNHTMEELKKFNLNTISPCHCTGFKATAMLWQVFPNEFVLNFSLRELEAGKMPEERLI
jgi:7,8-dihydropterin-6-yl-methyl-4-(beta-D-ribofuranosyl)aminobenzene 5'-phosphate synthase